MTSPVITTQITRVDATDDEDKQTEDIENSFEAHFSSDSDSDDYLDDNRYETTTETDICEEALQKLKELFVKNNFHKLEIIQRKSGKNETKSQILSHVVLTDKKLDPLAVNDFNNKNRNYLFQSKAKLLKEWEQKQLKAKKTLKIDVQIDEIPKTFEEFLKLVFNLKAELIFDDKSKLLFKKETHYRDIRFQSHDIYISSHIPFVMRELWNHLKTKAKQELNSYQTTYHKTEATEPSNESNEIVLSHIRNKSFTQSVFSFGQLVVIKYPESQSKDSPESELQSYFGIVIDVTTQLIDKSSEQLSHPLLRSQTNCEENDFILETIYVYCNPLDQNFDSVCVTPITCVQKYLAEARIVYELNDQKYAKIFEQILKPIFKFGSSGFSVNLTDEKSLFDKQKDSIQKAYEVCIIPMMEGFSSFVAIYGGPKTGKTKVLTETALQLLKIADEKVKKLIIIAMADNHLKDIIEILKKNEIKVFHIDGNGNCLSHKNSDFRRLIKKMNKDNKLNDICGKDYSIDQVLKYYGGDIQLSDLFVKDLYVKEIIFKRVVDHLIGHSQVIIGSISSVMNSEAFNRIYNMNDTNVIECGLIDEAHLLTETELWTLLFSGVRRFALFGDISVKPISYERSESFLKRFIELYNKSTLKENSNYDSVLFLKESIASLQRLAERSQRQKNHNNNNFGRGRGRGRSLDAYRSVSNYGSEYFNRSDRFKDYKPFKAENKDGIKPTNAYSSHQRPEQSRGGPNSSQSTSQVPHNSMIDGIVPQLAYGSRDSYLSHTYTDYNSHMSGNRNGMSGANSDPNANFASNGSQFVSNPTRHQNYNLF